MPTNTVHAMLRDVARLRIRIGNRVFLAMLGALLLSVLAAIFADSWMESITEQNKKIYYTNGMVRNLNQVQANILKAESAQRGYLLTKKSDYIEPYKDSIKRTRSAITKLLASYGDNKQKLPEEKKLTAKLTAAIEAKIAEMEITIDLQDAGKSKDALALVNMDKGLEQMADISSIISDYALLLNTDLNSLISKRNKSLSWARLSIFLSILVLIVVVFYTFKMLVIEIIEKDKAKDQINEENRQYEIRLEENRKLLQSIALDAQSDIERERYHLARELHDELGSILTATKMDISWVMKKAKEIAPDIHEKLTRTVKYLDQGIQFKRQVVENLHPSMITTFGLWAAIRNMAEESATRNQWDLTINLPDDSCKLNNTLGLTIFRVVQETMNNASKYAQAKHLTLDIMVNDAMLKLEMMDDGIGIDLSTLDNTTHGLSGMRHRIQAIGGKIEFESAPGKGMLTRVFLPLI